MTTATAERRPNTRERILDSTAEHFRRYGYSGTGLKQIVAAAGAQLGSLYHFFPGGKDELAAETIHRGGRMYQDVVEAVFDHHADLVDGVDDMYRAAGAVLEETDYADACPIATVALEVANSNEPLRQATSEVFEGWITALAGRLRESGFPEERARPTAVALIALLEGSFVLSRAMRTTEALEAAAEMAVPAVARSLDV